MLVWLFAQDLLEMHQDNDVGVTFVQDASTASLHV